MSYPSKTQRETCWNARDKFWECLDLNNEDTNACLEWRKEYKNSCSSVWVKHFDRKRKYQKYKEEMEKKEMESLQKESRSTST